MPLEWFRLDTDFIDNPKISALMAEHAANAVGLRAAFGYICAIGWSVRHETDGFIPAKKVNQNGTTRIRVSRRGAELLVKYELWEPAPGGWMIHNFAERQQLSIVAAKRRWDGLRAACKRWHPENCWDEIDGCSRIE